VENMLFVRVEGIKKKKDKYSGKFPQTVYNKDAPSREKDK